MPQVKILAKKLLPKKFVARLKDLRKWQKNNSTEVDDTAAAPAGGSAADTAETDGAAVVSDPRTTAAE